MKKYLNLILTGTLLFVSAGMKAQAPSGYYDSLEGKSGDALKTAIKTIAKKGHHAISYGDNTWDAFRSTDVRTVNGKECWWDMYSNNNVAVSSGHSGMNIEHSVANSWWGGTKNDAYKDIVHLNPSNADANSRKANYPLGEIKGASTWDNGITFIGAPESGQGGGCTRVYEPHDMYKGDFARVFMYMFVVYDDITWKEASSSSTDGKGRMYNYSGGKATLQPWAYNLMLSWSANDPVSEKEINRNNGIYKEQGNRNPFIDLPDLADYIWGSKQNEAYHLDGDHQPEPGTGTGDNNGDNNGSDDDKDPIAPDMEGKYVLVNSSSNLIAGDKYIIVSSDSHLALSTEVVKDKINPTSELTISDNIISEVAPNTAIFTLESTGSGYRLHAEDINGKNIGYLASPKAKDLSFTESASDAGTTATISIAGEVASISYGSAGYLKYNESAKIFRTYASGQKDIAMYRFIPANIPSSVGNLPVESGRFRVIVKGNNIIAPEGSLIFDLNGRRVSGENLDAGVYIVVSAEKGKSVKAIIQ